MESLNYYVSDGESDSSSNVTVSKKSFPSNEADANCEPTTMDMSEESSSGRSDDETHQKKGKDDETKRPYSKSLSPSPQTSNSSDSIDHKKRIIDGSPERYKSDVKGERDNNRRKKNGDDRDSRRENKKNKSSSRRHERKRSYRSRSRSRSSSYGHNRSHKRKYRSKSKSRSRSRSHDRYRHRSSPRKNHSRRKSPYRSKRSRSRSHSREKPRIYDQKSSSKLKVLKKLGIELKVPTGILNSQGGSSNISAQSGQVTAQMLLQKSMEHEVEKVKSATGIALPSYYNPLAINPSKYAEQIQKRKLLWGSKNKPVNETPSEPVNGNDTIEKQNSGTIWQGATFGGDQDGKMTAKFQRLMGIKNQGATQESKGDGSDLIKKQEEMFNSMESQYEVARLATHSHRGLGLGFGTFQPK